MERENCQKHEEEIVALKVDPSKAKTKACLNQKFIKGSKNLQDILNMQKSHEDKIGLCFKSLQQNVKDKNKNKK